MLVEWINTQYSKLYLLQHYISLNVTNNTCGYDGMERVAIFVVTCMHSQASRCIQEQDISRYKVYEEETEVIKSKPGMAYLLGEAGCSFQ